MRISPRFIGAFVAAHLISAGQVGAQTADLLPTFSYDDALSCLAYQVVDLEHQAPADPAKTATEMVFWSRLLAAKGSPQAAAAFDAQFADALDSARSVYLRLSSSDPTTSDHADYDLTMMGKFCWYQALAVEGAGPFAEE